MKSERLTAFIRDVRALVKSIRFDDHGEMVAGRFVGGNGGLVSEETLDKCEAVARQLDVIEAQYR